MKKINGSKRFCAIFVVLAILIVMQISMVSAFEFDNKKNYDHNTKTIEIRNSILGIPFLQLDKVADIKLNTPINNIVPVGYQKVAEFEIINYENYNGPLRKLEFFNIKNNMKKTEREFDYRYKTTKTIEDYGIVCINNQTCSEQKLGEHEIDYWEPLRNYNPRKDEEITIGIFTDVQEGDYVEWIPTFYGVEIDEWASFSASLFADLDLYYQFDETTGSDVPDWQNNYTGVAINMENGDWKTTGCLIGNCLEIGGTDEWINTTFERDYEQGDDFSISFWINQTAFAGVWGYTGTTNGNYIHIAASGVGGVRFEFRDTDTNQINTDATGNISDVSWHNVILTRNTTADRYELYADGINIQNLSDTTTGTLEFNKIGFGIGALNNDNTAGSFWTGMVDEFGIWSRTLSQSEITQLYNEGVGVTPSNLTVELVSPTNNEVLNSLSVDYNCSGRDLSGTVSNMSVWTNESGTWQRYNTTTGLSGSFESQEWARTYTSDQTILWNCQACNNLDICEFSTNQTVIIDTSFPLITVETPLGILDYNFIGGNETLNVTFTDTTLDKCWYDYNGTNVTIDGCVSGVKNSTLFILETDNFNMTIYTNDSSGNENFTSIEWNYKVLELNQEFNNITTEGATEQFTINFTKSSSLQISTIDLIYNNILNSFPYSVSDDNVTSQGSITVPIISSDTNLTFYWNITFGDGSNVITKSNNQTVLVINVDNCSVFTNLIYNFTQYDEADQNILTGNNSIELQINLYDTRKTSLLVNFSSEFFDINPVQFCAEDPILPSVNYSSYVILKYFVNDTNESRAYSVEYYNILNQTIGNTTIPKNIALYNLKVEETTKFRLTFRDGEYVLAPNILVQVHRQYIKDNDFKVVEIPLTDSNGQTVLNLVKDSIIYNFIMVNEAGEIVGNFNSIAAFCADFSIGDCSINLAPDSLSENIYDYNEEFDISISDPSYDNSTQIISMSFITGDLIPNNVRMEIVRNNDFGNRSVCSDSLFAASGVLSCSVSSITDTDQFLFISTFVEGDLAKEDTANLNSDILNFGTLNGAFYAFLFILFLITMFMEDRKILVISLGLGWVGVISLGLVSGKFIGFTSAGIWILITIAVFLWKLNKEDSV